MLDGPPRGIDLEPFDIRRELSPVLVRANDGHGATLVYHWTSLPGGTIYGVRYLPFKPFEAWPSTDFGPTYGDEPYDLQDPIAAAPGFGSDGTVGYNVAVLAHDPGFSAETGGMLFIPGTSPPFSKAKGIVLESLDEGTPAFVAVEADRHLVGYTVLTPNSGSGSGKRGTLRGGFVTSGKYLPDPLLSESACATAAVVADAVPFGQTFLVASSTSRVCCSCDDGVDGMPDKVVVRVVGSSEKLTFAGDRQVSFVKLVAKKSGGAWLLVGRVSNALPSSVELAEIGPNGELVAAPTTIAMHVPAFAVSAAALGDDLAMATHRTAAGGSAIDIDVYGPSGHTQQTLALPTSFADRVPTLLGSAAGTQLVVAWSAPDVGNDFLDHIKLARFARTCSAP